MINLFGINNLEFFVNPDQEGHEKYVRDGFKRVLAGELVDHIGAMCIFSHLNDHQLLDIADGFTLRVFELGERIIEANKPIHFFDFIKRHNTTANSDYNINITNLPGYKATLYERNIKCFKGIDGSRNPMIHKDIFGEKTVKDTGKDNDKRASLLNNLKKGQVNGKGYVIDSIRSAIYPFYSTDNYSDAIITACYLGNETDTTNCWKKIETLNVE
ncbi:unnamed protein product [Adineta steineri]|uniref:Cyclic nucleotide-binding domain-containing protein n=2 Tax=Adineta steineri TaxID=433720 RepID=A0A815ALN0_9BILA|nr:unnamed protein product [Adineta steineri]